MLKRIDREVGNDHELPLWRFTIFNMLSRNPQMSNKEVVSLESVEQRVYFVRGLQIRSRASIKGRLFKDSVGLRSVILNMVLKSSCQNGKYLNSKLLVFRSHALPAELRRLGEGTSI